MAQKVSSLAIDINVTGAPQASAALDGVDKKGASAAESLGTLAKRGLAASAAIGAVTVASQKFLEAAEQYNRINARIALVTKSTAEAADVNQKLFDIAQKTGVEMENVVQVYSRIALSARDLGATQSQMLQLVQNVTKSLQVSGSTAAEAAGSSIQFVQALASGKLRAEELNSQLEGNSFLAMQIAAGMRMSTAELREAVTAGRVLSKDVLDAVLRQTGSIDEAFNKIGTSMERSGQRLSNSFNRALSSIDQKIGASKFLSALFDSISEGLDGRSPGGVLGGSANTAGGGNAYTAGFIPGRAPKAASSRPVVGMGNRTNLPTVTVTADRPRPATPRPNTGRASGPGNARSTVDPRPGQLSGIRTGTIAAFGPNLPNIQEAIEAQSNAFAESVQPLLQTAQGMGVALVDSFANGITAAVQSGSLGEGLKELGRSLIGGLGAMVRDFGIQSLMASTLMQKLFTSLASFLPGGAVAASAGLIALGSVMVGLAGRGARASFGTTNTGLNRGAATSSTITERGSIGLPSSIFGGGAPASGISGSVAERGTMVNVSIGAVIGPNDPGAQRQIAELIKRGTARGAV